MLRGYVFTLTITDRTVTLLTLITGIVQVVSQSVQPLRVPPDPTVLPVYKPTFLHGTRRRDTVQDSFGNPSLILHTPSESFKFLLCSIHLCTDIIICPPEVLTSQSPKPFSLDFQYGSVVRRVPLTAQTQP